MAIFTALVDGRRKKGVEQQQSEDDDEDATSSIAKIAQGANTKRQKISDDPYQQTNFDQDKLLSGIRQMIAQQLDDKLANRVQLEQEHRMAER